MATLPGVAVLRGFLSPAACAELQHAARCVPAPGYRPHVLAAPLPLLARVAPGLLPPLLAVRGASRKPRRPVMLSFRPVRPLMSPRACIFARRPRARGG